MEGFDMRDLDKIKAVDELMHHDNSAGFADGITWMWESWITNPSNDGTQAETRGEMLGRYNALMNFLRSIVD
jgi:hypothetical protein